MAARKMPQNLEAEMSVLGVAFLNKNALSKICEEITSDMLEKDIYLDNFETDTFILNFEKDKKNDSIYYLMYDSGRLFDFCVSAFDHAEFSRKEGSKGTWRGEYPHRTVYVPLFPEGCRCKSDGKRCGKYSDR